VKEPAEHQIAVLAAAAVMAAEHIPDYQKVARAAQVW
jgi:hypothetical protein